MAPRFESGCLTDIPNQSSDAGVNVEQIQYIPSTAFNTNII